MPRDEIDLSDLPQIELRKTVKPQQLELSDAFEGGECEKSLELQAASDREDQSGDYTSPPHRGLSPNNKKLRLDRNQSENNDSELQITLRLSGWETSRTF